MEGQDEGRKEATRKVEDDQKTLFPRNDWGPLGCHLLSSLAPKSTFRGTELFGDLWGVICYHHWYPRAGLEGPEKSYFSKKVLKLKKMQNYPLSIFHASVWPESLPGADLSTFQKVIFSLFSCLFGPFSPQFSTFLVGRVAGYDLASSLVTIDWLGDSQNYTLAAEDPKQRF